MLGAGALGRLRGMVWGGRREEGSGWGTHVYLWRIHFDIWQNQYNIVKFKKKKKEQENNTGNFLAVQWLGLRVFTVKGLGLDHWSGNKDPRRFTSGQANK